MESQSLVLLAYRLPKKVEIGSELELLIKGRVRRIEAEHFDISGYSGTGASAVLEGDIYVEFAIMDVGVQ